MLKFLGILLLVIVIAIGGVALSIYSYLSPDEQPPRLAAPSSVRVIDAGEIVGFQGKNDAHAWLGIPFAQPPLNDLRWQAPRPVVPWEGRKEMLEFGESCVQFPMVPQDGGLTPVGSEDCLTLNVFAPTYGPTTVPEGRDKLPVMFWIHGGGNTVGSSSDAPYDGSLLATEHGVIVVTVNYRMGPIGWFAHSALRETASTPEDQSGNFGTLDLVKGLTWVQSNIEAFGGDPTNVTIFGESAGGVNVLAMMASPAARGLFHKAIIQSGIPALESADQAEQIGMSPRGTPNLSSREIIARLLVNEGRASDFDAAVAMQDEMPANELMIWLRSIDAVTLYEALVDGDAIMGGMIAAPANIKDGYVLPDLPTEEVFSNPANYAQVPIMIGSNRDESKLFMAFSDEYVEKTMGLPSKIKDLEGYNRDARYGSNLWKARGVDMLADQFSLNDPGNVYAYRFDADDWRNYGSVDLKDLFGAAHAMELFFVFGYFSNPLRVVFPDSTFDEVELLSGSMMSYWAEFAHSGNPGQGRAGEEPAWLPWGNNGGGSFNVLDTELDGGIRMEQGMLTVASVKAEMMEELAGLGKDERCFSYTMSTMVGHFDDAEYESLGCVK